MNECNYLPTYADSFPHRITSGSVVVVVVAAVA